MRAVLAQERAERREWEKLERGKKEGERAVNSSELHIVFEWQPVYLITV